MTEAAKKLADKPTHNFLTDDYRELRFIDEYIETGDKRLAYERAFPESEIKDKNRAANRLLSQEKVRAEINRRAEIMAQESIMSMTDIQVLLSRIAKGEVPDQFGLDASLQSRISAIKELTKLQLELAKLQETDNTLSIKIIH